MSLILLLSGIESSFLLYGEKKTAAILIYVQKRIAEA